MNSVMSVAGQEMTRNGAAFSTAQISPSIRATAKPITVAWIVTHMPISRIGRMEAA